MTNVQTEASPNSAFLPERLSEHFIQPTQVMAKSDYFHLMWQQIQNEDSLVNQRLIWIVLSQSFLFTAFATILNAPEHSKHKIYSHLQDALIWAIPCMAILASILVYISVLTSLANIRNLRHAYEQYPDDPSIIAFPELQSKPELRWLASLPPLVLPLVFIGTWLAILIVRIVSN